MDPLRTVLAEKKQKWFHLNEKADSAEAFEYILGSIHEELGKDCGKNGQCSAHKAVHSRLLKTIHCRGCDFEAKVMLKDCYVNNVSVREILNQAELQALHSYSQQFKQTPQQIPIDMLFSIISGQFCFFYKHHMRTADA